MRVLEVHLQGKAIGHIVETRRGARFEYEPEAVQAHPGKPLLSLALPVKKKPFGEAKTRNWFEGLLPEGERRNLTCHELGIDPYDWVGLLSEIGWECAGAVQVFPKGKALNHSCGLVHLGDPGLAERLASISAQQPASETEFYRMSLGGYQNKLCVVAPPLEESGQIIKHLETALPQGSEPSTHILKPEPANYPGLAESEAWAMTAAGFAAQASRIALLKLDDAPQTLVVERYDREILAAGKVRRLHQEDACQALGLPIERKCASSPAPKGDDPTYRGIAGLLSQFSTAPQAQMEELLGQLTVNLALGNWDAHAKNTSLLYPKLADPIIAPLYDVVPIAEVEPRTKLLSMRVNGTLNPEEVNGSSLVAEAASWGLGETASKDVVLSTLDRLEAGMGEASKTFPAAAARHEKEARARIRKLQQMR